MQVKEHLDNIHNLKDLSLFVKNLYAEEIGFLGGRRFSHTEDDGDVCLNDIIRKFESLPKDNNKAAIKIRREIKTYDIESTENLRKANVITKFFTFVRSILNPIHLLKSQNEVLREIGNVLPAKEKSIYLFEQIFDEKTKGIDQTDLDSLKYAFNHYIYKNDKEFEKVLFEKMDFIIIDDDPEKAEKGEAVISSLLYNLATDKEAELLKPYYKTALIAYAKCKDDWEDLELRDYKTGKTVKISEEMKTEVRDRL